jgi:DNA-directed RNA polymerase subunit K/omega
MVNIASQRARQLMQGAAPVIRTKSRKPAAIAIREVQKGLLPYFMTEDAPSLGSEEDVEEEDE